MRSRVRRRNNWIERQKESDTWKREGGREKEIKCKRQRGIEKGKGGGQERK